MPTLNLFELRQRFRKSCEYLWTHRIFAGTVYRLNVAKFQMFSMRKDFTFAIAKVKYLGTWNFLPKCPPSTSSSWGKDFENRLNTFGNIGFLLAQCTGRKWQNFKCYRCENFSHCHCKSKIPSHLKHSTQMPTLHIFELRQRFRKSLKYLWRYRIIAGTVYMLKVAKFQMLLMREVVTFNCKSKIPAHLKHSTQIPTVSIFELDKDLEDRVNTSGDILFLLEECTGWKWQNFKCCSSAKFSPCHFKSKRPAHQKRSTQMPTVNIFELDKDLGNRVNTFADILFLLAQCTGWKWQNFKCCRCAKLSLCHCKIEYLRTWNIPPKFPPSTSSGWTKISKIVWIPLVIYCFCWQSVQVESGKISNVVHRQSFHLAISKVKHLHTWNFPPKCPPSTSSSWGKDFENRLNTFGDIGLLLAQCTCWKWQNFKCCWCVKLSLCHCKSKIPAH